MCVRKKNFHVSCTWYKSLVWDQLGLIVVNIAFKTIAAKKNAKPHREVGWTRQNWQRMPVMGIPRLLGKFHVGIQDNKHVCASEPMIIHFFIH